METVDELCMELEKATKDEKFSINESCPSTHMKFACSRPRGHLGLHIALGSRQGLIMLWHDTLSDTTFDDWKVFWEEMEKAHQD